MKPQNNSIRQRIIAMAVGEELEFPLSVNGNGTIRTYASDISVVYQRAYSTRRDKERRVSIIRREA